METRAYSQVNGKLQVTRNIQKVSVESISWNELQKRSAALDSSYQSARKDLDELIAAARLGGLDLAGEITLPEGEV